MKRDEVPVSLFSFQDIVTTLIGIMVIVILVISLQMLQTVQDVAQDYSAPDDDRYETMVARLAAIKDETASLQTDDSDASSDDEAIRPFLEMTHSQQVALVARLEEEGEDLEFLIKQLQARQETLAAAEEADALSAEEVRRRIEESRLSQETLERQRQATEEAIENLQQRLRELQDARDAVQDAIARKERQLEFTFPGRRTHTPVIIECLGNGFRASVYPLDGGVEEFTSADFHGNLKALCAWLGKFDAASYYPVLLYRSKSFARSREIEKAVQEVNSRFRLGRDPVPASVTVFE